MCYVLVAESGDPLAPLRAKTRHVTKRSSQAARARLGL